MILNRNAGTAYGGVEFELAWPKVKGLEYRRAKLVSCWMHLLKQRRSVGRTGLYAK